MKRTLIALLVIAWPLLAAGQAVTRTGDNAIKIPLSASLHRVTSTPNPSSPRPPPTGTVCIGGACSYTPAQMANIAFSDRGQDDIIELQNVAPGVAEVWNARSICDGVNGAAGHEIMFRVRDGDKITFSNVTGNNNALFSWNNCSYVIFEGDSTGRDALNWGNRSQWAQTCAIAQPHNCYSQWQTLRIINSHHLSLVGQSFSGANDFTGNQLDKVSHDIYIGRSLFSLHGTNNLEGATPIQDSGNLTNLWSQRLIVEDTEFSFGGHSQLESDGPTQVFRRVLSDGSWLGKGTGWPGNHAGTFENNRTQGTATFGANIGFGPALIEDSIFRNANQSVDGPTNEGIKFNGLQLIFRHNYMWDNVSAGAISTCATQNDTQLALTEAYSSVYNVSLFNSPQVFFTQGFGYPANVAAATCANFYVFNDLFQGITPNVNKTSRPWAVQWDLAGNTTPTTGYNTALKAGYWHHNIFGAHPTTPTANMQFRVTGAGFTSKTTDVTVCDFADASVPGGFSVCNNSNVQLAFAGGTSNPTRSKAGFALAPTSTIGIGDAAPATTTTDAGTNDTTLTFAWPRLFKDDWGFGGYVFARGTLQAHREYGDCVCVGPASSSTVNQCVSTRIADSGINYTTGAVTVVTGVTHAVGSPVWPATQNPDGSCGAPWRNRGAWQQ